MVPRFHQRAGGLPIARSVVAGDPFDFAQGGPSLRLKTGFAQDDAVDEKKSRRKNSS